MERSIRFLTKEPQMFHFQSAYQTFAFKPTDNLPTNRSCCIHCPKVPNYALLVA